MTEKTLTTENIKPALDALRGELAPWPVVAKKQDRLNTAQLNAANSGITSSLVAQIIANTAAIRALESAITGTGLRALVVASLPAVGTTGILYIVPVTTYDPETDADVVNYSNEYLWIPVEAGQASEGHYEQVGQTGIVINNGQLTITVNGTSVGTFTANQSGDTTAAITVPTNADYVDRTTDQTVAGVKTFSSTINGTASKAIADEDGTSIKTGYVNVAGNQTVSGRKTWSAQQKYTGDNTRGILSVYNSSYTKGSTISATDLSIGTIFLGDGGNTGLGNSLGIISCDLASTGNRSMLSLSAIKNEASSTERANLILEYDKSDTASPEKIKCKGTVLPNSTNTYSLGSSSYQWSSVYAQTYYYNGTQWGLDRANVWTGANTFSAGVLTTMVETSPGNTGLVIRSTDQTWESGARIFLYSNTQTGQTNGSIYVDVDHGDNSNTKTGLTLVPNAFHPMGGTVNTTYGVSLGTATYQWAKVYSEQYYYNGTAWGLDKENQWLAKQIIKQDTIDITTNPSAEKIGKSLYFYDGSRFWAQYIPVWGTDGSFRMELGLSNYTTSGGQGYWTVANRISKDFTTFDFYTSHGNANLGTSTNKWKTLNGVNPGALSLPDVSNAVSIDTTNVSMDGTYTYLPVSVNGWLYVALRDTVCSTDGELTFYVGDSGTSSAYAKWAVNFVCSTDGYVRCFIPVLANNRIRIRINPNGGSPTGLAMTVYPCLGNV